MKKACACPSSANTGGYETVESVEAWRGYVDIWLADLKYASPDLARELSAAPRLPPAVAKRPSRP